MLSNQDTIVGNQTYRKIYALGTLAVITNCIEPPLGSLTPATPPSLGYLIREEGRKVYLWRVNTNNEQEFLAFDLDQQVGDTVPLYLPNIFTITSIEEIVLNGKTFKQYIIGPPQLHIDTIIEGIGNTGFPFLKYIIDGSTAPELICYSRNDTVYFQRYDSCGFFEYPPAITSVYENSNPITDPQLIQSIYPNPATNQVTIIFRDDGDYSVELFDQIGNSKQVEYFLNNSEIQMDLNSLQNGFYLLHIKHKGMLFCIRKLIVYH